MSVKNSNDTIGNRTSDLPVSSVVLVGVSVLSFFPIFSIYINVTESQFTAVKIN